MKKIWLIIITIAFFALTINANSQYGSFGITDAQSIGMGNTFGSSYGILSIGSNPAFLDYPKDSSGNVSLQIPGFSFKAIESAMSLEDFNNYFNYPEAKSLSEAERKEFLNSFGDNNGVYINGGTKFALAVRPSPMIGTLAFSLTEYVAGSATIPLTLVDLIINGNAQNKTYQFDDTNLKMWWIRNYTLSYAREILKFNDKSFIKSLTGGISIKMVQGTAYAGVEKFDAYLKTGENNALSGKVSYLAKTSFSKDLGITYDFDTEKYKDNYSPMMDPAGSGFGFDFGVAADLDYNLRVGLAITDIGSITWDQRTAEYRADGNIEITDLFDKDQQNELEDFLNDSSYAIGSFSTSLPTTLRLSIAYELSKSFEAIPGNLTAQLGYNQGFNDMPGNSTVPRVAVGVKWQTLAWIPVVYTGLSNNLAGEMAWALGLGFSTSALDFAIATQNITSFLSSAGKPHISLGMNFVWRIGF